jgi:DNA-binding NtrC family response regulator
MTEMVVVVVVDTNLRRRLQSIFRSRYLLVESTESATSAVHIVSRNSVDLLILDRQSLDGNEDLISSVRQLPDAPEILLLTEREDAEERASYLAMGCAAVLPQSLSAAKIRGVIESLQERVRARRPKVVDRVRSIGPPRLSDFVSNSRMMREFMSVVERVASSSTTLLLHGETGVGKERLAHAIHNSGPRSSGPFVAVNCAALTESLLESELFGHEEGAFTGAVRTRRGSFELADKGTLFLDEIGEMPLHLQVKLLRALQEREIQRVGGEKVIHVDVRVMAATNRDLAVNVEEGVFRRDLYYRLSVIALQIPPLRERREDIPELIDGYINLFRSQIPHQAFKVSPEAFDALVQHDWPGNVRELINVIERALLLSPHDEIRLTDLPLELRRYGNATAFSPSFTSWRKPNG